MQTSREVTEKRRIFARAALSQHVAVASVCLACASGRSKRTDDGAGQTNLSPEIVEIADPLSGNDDGDGGARGDESDPPSPKRHQGLMVDDFEDGDNLCLLGGSWGTRDDSRVGGRSVLHVSKDAEGQLVMDGEGHASARSLHVSYKLDQGDSYQKPYVLWWVSANPDDGPAAMSGYAGFTYWFRGSAHQVLVTSLDVYDNDYHRFVVPSSDEWIRVTVPFSDVRQEGWDRSVVLDLDNVAGFTWFVTGDTGDVGEVWIDDVQLVEDFAVAQ